MLPEYATNIEKYINLLFSQTIHVALERNVEYSLKELFTKVYSQINKKSREAAMKEYLEKLDTYNVTNTSYVLSTFEQKLRNPNSHYLFIYTDIIKSNIINGTELRVLLLKPFLTIWDRKEIDVSNILYHPIDKFRINEISILLSDEHGYQINFKKSTKSTCIMLHFLKKPI